MNVLDLPGPQFLQFYGAALAAAFFASIGLRQVLRGPGGDAVDTPGAKNSRLHPLDVAYLAGGPAAAADAAIAALVHGNVLTVDRASGRLAAASGLAAGAAPVERAVYVAAAAGGGAAVAAVRRAGRQAAGGIGELLRGAGMVPSRPAVLAVRLVPMLALLAVAGLGAAKISVGMSRHRPVGFLVLLTLAAVVVALVFALKSVWRTRRGDRVLARLRSSNRALQATAGKSPESLGGADLAMAFALFGPAMLAAGPMKELHRALYPVSTGGDGSSGSSCGSDSGGSSCGGGGCGGCGGGGD